jgi:hypothetical protein
MGTIIINGKRFDGSDITIRGGKVVIDGKLQDGELHGDVEALVVEGVSGSGQCIASVSCGEAAGDVAADVSVTANARAGGAIHAVAFASADNGRRKKER